MLISLRKVATHTQKLRNRTLLHCDTSRLSLRQSTSASTLTVCFKTSQTNTLKLDSSSSSKTVSTVATHSTDIAAAPRVVFPRPKQPNFSHSMPYFCAFETKVVLCYNFYKNKFQLFSSLRIRHCGRAPMGAVRFIKLCQYVYTAVCPSQCFTVVNT